MRDASSSARSRCRSGGKREEILELRSIRGARKAFDDLRLREFRCGEVGRTSGDERADMGRDKVGITEWLLTDDALEKSTKEFSYGGLTQLT